ncbi:MAG: hypothetical protein ACM3S2_17085, partial [Ignavibacteriales bacterium]
MRKFLQCITFFFCLTGILIPQTLNERLLSSVKPHSPKIESMRLRTTTHGKLQENFTARFLQRQQSINLKNVKLDSIYHPKQTTVDDSLRNTYTYDDSGNVKTVIIKFKSGGIWMN